MIQEENRQLINQVENFTRANKLRVSLICMPFAAANRPSIQIGLLKAIIDQAGFNADTYHLNLELAAKLHLDNYSPLCEHRGHMTGEWLFSIAAFGEKINLNDNTYFAAFPDEVKWIESIGKNSNFFSQLRHDIIPSFIDECVTMVDWSYYDLIAFSSTFQQNVASLALASRIKEKFPEVKIAFGGANMEGGMGLEYARAFPFIDYVMVGEGDVLFPSLLNALALGKVPESIPGLIARSLDRLHGGGQAQPIHNLDSLPTPNYEEYFERAKRLGLTQFISPLPFESSRGCWWGQKSHCTFCGLNGFNMTYRSKSTQRVLRELSEMAVKYRINTFEAVDNILDVKYVENLFSEIQATKTDYQFFYEIKANLNHNQIRSLYLGGVRAVQPGIESLNSHILKLMRKGSTMLLNVRLLKWCQYYGINVAWNLLWGFPGEKEEDYLNQLKVLKLISHLSPPTGCGRIWMERFSPYFVKKDEFPIKDLRPEKSYNFAYPLGVDLEKIAYFFDYTMEDTLPDSMHKETSQWIDLWKQNWGSNSQATLSYRRTLDALFIDDKRESEQGVSHAIYDSMALIYEYCGETMRSASQVFQHLELQGYCCSNNEVVEALNFFCQSGVMLSENGQYLSLALPANPNW